MHRRLRQEPSQLESVRLCCRRVLLKVAQATAKVLQEEASSPQGAASPRERGVELLPSLNRLIEGSLGKARGDTM